jgi:hypothetical protein
MNCRWSGNATVPFFFHGCQRSSGWGATQASVESLQKENRAVRFERSLLNSHCQIPFPRTSFQPELQPVIRSAKACFQVLAVPGSVVRHCKYLLFIAPHRERSRVRVSSTPPLFLNHFPRLNMLSPEKQPSQLRFSRSRAIPCRPPMHAHAIP